MNFGRDLIFKSNIDKYDESGRGARAAKSSKGRQIEKRLVLLVRLKGALSLEIEKDKNLSKQHFNRFILNNSFERHKKRKRERLVLIFFWMLSN